MRVALLVVHAYGSRVHQGMRVFWCGGGSGGGGLRLFIFLSFVLLYHCSSFGSSRGCCLVRTQPVNCDVIYFNSNLLFLLYIHAHVTLVFGQL